MGEEATKYLGPCIAKCAEVLGIRGICYESRNFKTGVDASAMRPIAPTLHALLEISLHFMQEDVEAAIDAEVYTHELYQASMKLLCATAGKSHKEFLWDQAYGLRTCLAHVVVRAKQFLKSQEASSGPVDEKMHPEWLRAMYPTVELHLANGEEQDTPTKEQPPAATCPFLLFRGVVEAKRLMAEESGDSDEEEDEVDDPNDTRMVFEGFDAGIHKAIRRYGSGRVQVAIDYNPAENGFLTAVFPDGEWGSEIPNSKYKDGKLVIDAPIDPSLLSNNDTSQMGLAVETVAKAKELQLQYQANRVAERKAKIELQKAQKKLGIDIDAAAGSKGGGKKKPKGNGKPKSKARPKAKPKSKDSSKDKSKAKR